jgi:hypothetical protein
LDVDISESDDEEDNDFKEIDSARHSDISEEDYNYEQTMDDIDNETKFT